MKSLWPLYNVAPPGGPRRKGSCSGLAFRSLLWVLHCWESVFWVFKKKQTVARRSRCKVHNEALKPQKTHGYQLKIRLPTLK